MNYLVAYLPAPYLKEMAEYFAKLRPPFAPKESTSAAPPVLARGQALVTKGDAG